jgi:hypothetical protein
MAGDIFVGRSDMGSIYSLFRGLPVQEKYSSVPNFSFCLGMDAFSLVDIILFFYSFNAANKAPTVLRIVGFISVDRGVSI